MTQWRVIGVDRVSGSGRTIYVEADTKREAMDRANDRGILVERVDLYDVDKPDSAGDPFQNRELATHSPELYEPINANKDSKSISNAVAEYLKVDLRLPYFGEKRRRYQERGVNTVGEIAAGVFFGLLIFSCFSPLIVFFVMAFWIAWARSMFPPPP